MKDRRNWGCQGVRRGGRPLAGCSAGREGIVENGLASAVLLSTRSGESYSRHWYPRQKKTRVGQTMGCAASFFSVGALVPTM